MSGGVLNLTVGTGANGSLAGAENTITVSKLSGTSGTIQAGKDNTSGSLVVSGSESSTFGGTITNGGGTGRVVRLTKSGAGTLELTSANTYTGSTSIQGGTLLLSGSGAVSASSAITVNGSSSALRHNATGALGSGVTLTNGGALYYNSSSAYAGALTWTNGTLGGTNWSGNLDNLTVSAGRTISAGNSIGTATTTNQTWAEGGASTWEIQNVALGAGTGWDLLNLDGALTLSLTEGSPFVISIVGLGVGGPSGFDAGTDYQWLIVDAEDAISGFATNLFAVNASNFGTYGGTFGIAQGGSLGIGGDASELYLTYTVPEPGTVALVSAGMMLVLWNLRRRRLL